MIPQELTLDLMRKNMEAFTEILRHSDDRIVYAGGVGSISRPTLYNVSQDRVYCGCFQGTLAQFKDQILKTYGDRDTTEGECIEYISMYKFFCSAREGARLKASANSLKACIKGPVFAVGVAGGGGGGGRSTYDAETRPEPVGHGPDHNDSRNQEARLISVDMGRCDG